MSTKAFLSSGKITHVCHRSRGAAESSVGGYSWRTSRQCSILVSAWMFFHLTPGSVPCLWVPGYFSILHMPVNMPRCSLSRFENPLADRQYSNSISQLHRLGLVLLLAMYQPNEMLCLLKFFGHLYPTSAVNARGSWYHFLNHSVVPHGVLKTAGPSLTILFPWKFSSETFSLRKKEVSKSCTVRRFQKY